MEIKTTKEIKEFGFNNMAYIIDKKWASLEDHKKFAEETRQLLALVDDHVTRDQTEFLLLPIRNFAERWAEVLEGLE